MATQPEATGPQTIQPVDSGSNREVFVFLNTQLDANRTALRNDADANRRFFQLLFGICTVLIVFVVGFASWFGYKSIEDFKGQVARSVRVDVENTLKTEFNDPKLKQLISQEAVKAVQAQAGPTIRDTTKKWEINILMGRIQNDEAFAFDELAKLSHDSGISPENLVLAKNDLRETMQKYDFAPSIFGGFPASISGEKENELVLKLSSPTPMERRRALAELIPTVWADPAKLFNIATTDPFLSVRCDAARVLAVRLKDHNFPTTCLARQEMLDLWPHIARVVQ